jgi:hypothetical protein
MIPMQKVHDAIRSVEPDSILLHFDRDILLHSEDKRLTRLFTRPDCPTVLLSFFSQSFAEEALIAVAASPAQNESTQSLLMFHNRSLVRQALAENPALSLQTMLHLINDPENDVRRGLAGNPSASAEMLVRLLDDDYLPVREAAIANHNIPQQNLMEIARSNSSSGANSFANLKSMIGVTKNPSAPPEALSLLMKYQGEKEFDVKARVAVHGNTPAIDSLAFLIELGASKKYSSREPSEISHFIDRIMNEKRLDILLAAKRGELDLSRTIDNGLTLSQGLIEADWVCLNEQILSLRLEGKANKLIENAEAGNNSLASQSRKL